MYLSFQCKARFPVKPIARSAKPSRVMRNAGDSMAAPSTTGEGRFCSVCPKLDRAFGEHSRGIAILPGDIFPRHFYFSNFLIRIIVSEIRKNVVYSALLSLNPHHCL